MEKPERIELALPATTAELHERGYTQGQTNKLYRLQNRGLVVRDKGKRWKLTASGRKYVARDDVYRANVAKRWKKIPHAVGEDTFRQGEIIDLLLPAPLWAIVEVYSGSRGYKEDIRNHLSYLSTHGRAKYNPNKGCWEWLPGDGELHVEILKVRLQHATR
mgnify:FL=1